MDELRTKRQKVDDVIDSLLKAHGFQRHFQSMNVSHTSETVDEVITSEKIEFFVNAVPNQVFSAGEGEAVDIEEKVELVSGFGLFTCKFISKNLFFANNIDDKSCY